MAIGGGTHAGPPVSARSYPPTTHTYSEYLSDGASPCRFTFKPGSGQDYVFARGAFDSSDAARAARLVGLPESCSDGKRRPCPGAKPTAAPVGGAG